MKLCISLCLLLSITIANTTIADPSDPHIFSYQFPVNPNPIGITIDSNEALWVSLTDPAHKIEKYDTEGNLIVSVGLPFTGTPMGEYHFSQPRGIAVDSQDNVYVADFDPGRIQKYDSNGNFVLMWGWGVATGADQFEVCYENCKQRRAPSVACPAGDVPFPVGVEVDELDRVWVRANCNRVQVFDHNGDYLGGWPDGTVDIYSTGWLTLDLLGNVFLTHSDAVHKFNLGGSLSAQWSKSAAGPIEVDSFGDVYTVGYWNQGFWKYDKDGNFLVNFGQDADFDQPSGMAFGPNNTLYAVDRHHALIKVFSPPYELLSCTEFEPPMANYPVRVRHNRALPLKAEVFDTDGYAMTDNDLTAPPVVQVWFDSGDGGDAVDVTDDVLAVGQGDEGNQFVFIEGERWQFNLSTKNYTSTGTYTVLMQSGDKSEYVIEPTCMTEFVIK